MELTSSEKRTIFHILILIMEADLVIKQEEIDFLDKVIARFGLSVAEFDHTELLDFDNLAKEFSTFSKDKKQDAKEIFLGMAACDGYVDAREKALIDKLCD